MTSCRPSPARCTSITPDPPMPHIIGSITPCTSALVTAASTAGTEETRVGGGAVPRPGPARRGGPRRPGRAGARPPLAQHEVGDQSRPAGLVRGAQALAGVAVEVLVKLEQVVPGTARGKE